VHELILHHRLTALAIPVDDHGLRVDRLRETSPTPALVHVTPSHQYPLGMRMNVGRRGELVEWARANRAVVIEDDYDSEFRFDGPPLPTLAALDRDCVVYLGTLSKALSPAVRCGFLVARPDVAREVARIKELVDGPLSWPLQRALVEFFGSGSLDQHVRRVRHHYARARAQLLDGLAEVDHLVRVTGTEAGLHVTLRLVRGGGAGELVARARARGLAITDVRAMTAHAGVGDDTLVIAYAGLTDGQVRVAAQELVDLIRESAGVEPRAPAAPRLAVAEAQMVDHRPRIF
jgi:GntR family transcriptional regulator/MocR family aminotransferase